MKRAELLFAFLLVPLDLLAIFLAFTFAYLLRANVEVPPVTYLWPLNQYLEFIAATLPAWVAVFALGGLYDVSHLRIGSGELKKVFLAVSAGMALVVLGIFFTRTSFFSRLIILYAYLFSLLFVRTGRVFLREVQRYFYRYGIGVQRLLVIGSGQLAENVVDEIRSAPHLGYELVRLRSKQDLPRLRQFLKGDAIDEVLLVDSTLTSEELARLVELTEEERVVFKQVPTLFEVKAVNVNVGTLAGIPLVEFKKTPLDGWGRILKRIFDVIVAVILLVILSPVMGLIALLIKLDSPGPVIYRNRRVGPYGLFSIYKFRSMYTHFSTGAEYGGKRAEELENKLIKKKSGRVGPVFKIIDDPRRTRLGRLLEKTSLDELPQLFNVLQGNMSLIGPRPHMPKEVSQYQQSYNKLLHVKPGMTGLAQISGRSELSTKEEVRLDTYYVENWTPLLDLIILAKTPWAVLRRRRTVS